MELGYECCCWRVGGIRREGWSTACPYSRGEHPTVLTDIYQDHINIAIWQRSFDRELTEAISSFVNDNLGIKKSYNLSPDKAYERLERSLGDVAKPALLQDLANLVDMFCCLFDLGAVGLRLAVLDKAMCPRFHVDQVPCRLVTTYQGTATDWLPNDLVDRSKLGRGSHGLLDSESGVYRQNNDIHHLKSGDVALLKGDRWEGNENRGLVHRSPAVPEDGPRLLVTLDFGA
ncbi:DUF1826 domain-containing protein [Vibrio mexicanus]|uniref:DUF1826 domain-containing protein n=1 Tax=Vibrio mexicanus TaxID=1004326 RepID=UPI000A04254B|nr:DUF1826 domain-containing protein [Vibrio mexicanus]